ncbi:23S rRNA (pseudouridine1915-N3)-methyltransferase [Polynucleobacter meluiroseus]|uniref:Ribosomal RNA large subunit methyltransferase H n=1 Tax=Polynucleobacter meluiroseus TaxID=1938814 RepID=A0A240E2Y1_9BURK|nr:23S rRNA (pseudouridine(1915)-N(3))-methyltransferase RlmH [Polynucleobacter meluiroseus]SNX29230.1 23S rRNA (pseudouridine1915-N3)-methyltransferase [Polynucleobacter meluiroseus]
MRLTIIAVGHKMPDWVASVTQDYLKRMPADCSIEIKELKPDLTPAKEAVKIAAAIPKGAHVIALDERGKDLTTQNIATQLAHWRQTGLDVAFLIGGADGLDANLKDSAQALWRLSSLTLPHAMARLLLVEQLYRAWTILQGHPYHRE